MNSAPDETMISVLNRIQHAAERLTVRSALNPFLWLCAISLGLLLMAVAFAQFSVLQPLCPLLVYIVVAVWTVAILVGIWFALFNPGKLQSEEYQLKQQALSILQQMGAAPKEIDPASIAAIANPALAQRSLPKEAD